MANFQSRLWLPSAAFAFTLLLLCLIVIATKASHVIKPPSIQDVFTGEKHEFSADLGQLPNIVPPTTYVATPPENHGPQYRTVDWLKAQGSLAWTLQVMSSEDEDIVKSYIAQREDKEQFAYFMYKEGETISYVAVYGNYVTMELALGVAETTDFSLANGVRASPEKFMTYVAHVPMIQPAIDQPPPAKYGGVPEVVIEAEEEEALEPAPSDTEGDDTIAPSEPVTESPIVDPF